MNIFKKLLASLCLLLSASVFASAPNTNYSWITFSGGALENGCRMLWKEYDTIYNTTTVIMPPKPGLGGGLVVDDLLRSGKSNSAICMGPSQFILNPILFPGRTKEDQLEPIVMATRWAWVWYSSADAPVGSFEDLIKYFKSLNRPINVGTFIPVFSLIEPILNQHGVKVNLVNFRNAPQQYPSLADGTLDLAFDTGPGIQIAAQNKRFKPVGYIDLARNPFYSDLKNFASTETDLKALMTAGGIIVAVQKSMPNEDKRLLTERLSKIVNSKSFKESVNTLTSHPVGMVAPELFYYLETNRRIIVRHWK